MHRLRPWPRQLERKKTIRPPRDERQIVRDQQQRQPPLRAERAEVLDDFPRRLFIHRRRRLIRQHHPRLVNERPRNRRPLPLPARERCRRLVELRRDSEPLRQRLHARREIGRAIDPPRQRDVLPHRQKAQQPAALEHIADLRPPQPGQRRLRSRRRNFHLRASEPPRTLGPQDQPEQIEQRAFSTPALPDDRHELPRAHAKLRHLQREPRPAPRALPHHISQVVDHRSRRTVSIARRACRRKVCRPHCIR